MDITSSLATDMLALFIAEARTSRPECFGDNTAIDIEAIKFAFQQQQPKTELDLLSLFDKYFFAELVQPSRPDCMQYFDRLFKHVYRTSRYGQYMFAMMLDTLLQDINEPISHVYAPGCGLFYEADSTAKLLKPQKITAADIVAENLDHSAAISKLGEKIDFFAADLSIDESLCRSGYNLFLCIHPEVTSWKQLSKQPAYEALPATTAAENLLPLSELKAHSAHCIDETWEKIFTQIFDNMQTGQRGVVIFYELRDLDVFLTFAHRFEKIRVAKMHSQYSIPEFRFVSRLTRPAEGHHVESIQYTSMHNYRCGVLVECCDG